MAPGKEFKGIGCAGGIFGDYFALKSKKLQILYSCKLYFRIDLLKIKLASSIILQAECTRLNDSLKNHFRNCFKMVHTSLRKCNFEEFEELVLQIIDPSPKRRPKIQIS